MRALLEAVMVWAIYPAWLVAGLVDYLSHRRTRIERTSGPRESWLHVAQFAVLGIAVAAGAWLEINRGVFALLAVCIGAHSAIAYADVAFTDGRRYIAPLEQHVHGYMEVLPVVALAMVAVLHWDSLSNSDWTFRVASGSGVGASVFVASYFILAGIPVLEELLRTSGGFRHHQVKDDHQRDESHDAERDPHAQESTIRGR